MRLHMGTEDLQINASRTEDSDDDYVPESLRSFVEQAQLAQYGVLSLISDEMSGDEVKKAVSDDYESALSDLSKSRQNHSAQYLEVRNLQGTRKKSQIAPLPSALMENKPQTGAFTPSNPSFKRPSSSNASHLRRLLNSSSAKMKHQSQTRCSPVVLPADSPRDSSLRNQGPGNESHGAESQPTPSKAITFAEKLKATLTPFSSSSSIPCDSQGVNVVSIPTTCLLVPPVRDEDCTTCEVHSTFSSGHGSQSLAICESLSSEQEDYVPESLRSLFEQADQALRETKEDCLSIGKSSSSSEGAEAAVLGCVGTLSPFPDEDLCFVQNVIDGGRQDAALVKSPGNGKYETAASTQELPPFEPQGQDSFVQGLPDASSFAEMKAAVESAVPFGRIPGRPQCVESAGVKTAPRNANDEASSSVRIEVPVVIPAKEDDPEEMETSGTREDCGIAQNQCHAYELVQVLSYGNENNDPSSQGAQQSVSGCDTSAVRGPVSLETGSMDVHQIRNKSVSGALVNSALQVDESYDPSPRCSSNQCTTDKDAVLHETVVPEMEAASDQNNDRKEISDSTSGASCNVCAVQTDTCVCESVVTGFRSNQDHGHLNCADNDYHEIAVTAAVRSGTKCSDRTFEGVHTGDRVETVLRGSQDHGQDLDSTKSEGEPLGPRSSVEDSSPFYFGDATAIEMDLEMAGSGTYTDLAGEKGTSAGQNAQRLSAENSENEGSGAMQESHLLSLSSSEPAGDGRGGGSPEITARVFTQASFDHACSHYRISSEETPSVPSCWSPAGSNCCSPRDSHVIIPEVICDHSMHRESPTTRGVLSASSPEKATLVSQSASPITELRGWCERMMSEENIVETATDTSEIEAPSVIVFSRISGQKKASSLSSASSTIDVSTSLDSNHNSFVESTTHDAIQGRSDSGKGENKPTVSPFQLLPTAHDQIVTDEAYGLSLCQAGVNLSANFIPSLLSLVQLADEAMHQNPKDLFCCGAQDQVVDVVFDCKMPAQDEETFAVDEVGESITQRSCDKSKWVTLDSKSSDSSCNDFTPSVPVESILRNSIKVKSGVSTSSPLFSCTNVDAVAENISTGDLSSDHLSRTYDNDRVFDKRRSNEEVSQCSGESPELGSLRDDDDEQNIEVSLDDLRLEVKVVARNLTEEWPTDEVHTTSPCLSPAPKSPVQATLHTNNLDAAAQVNLSKASIEDACVGEATLESIVVENREATSFNCGQSVTQDVVSFESSKEWLESHATLGVVTSALEIDGTTCFPAKADASDSSGLYLEASGTDCSIPQDKPGISELQHSKSQSDIHTEDIATNQQIEKGECRASASDDVMVNVPSDEPRESESNDKMMSFPSDEARTGIVFSDPSVAQIVTDKQNTDTLDNQVTFETLGDTFVTTEKDALPQRSIEMESDDEAMLVSCAFEDFSFATQGEALHSIEEVPQRSIERECDDDAMLVSSPFEDFSFATQGEALHSFEEVGPSQPEFLTLENDGAENCSHLLDVTLLPVEDEECLHTNIGENEESNSKLNSPFNEANVSLDVTADTTLSSFDTRRDFSDQLLSEASVIHSPTWCVDDSLRASQSLAEDEVGVALQLRKEQQNVASDYRIVQASCEVQNSDEFAVEAGIDDQHHVNASRSDSPLKEAYENMDCSSDHCTVTKETEEVADAIQEPTFFQVEEGQGSDEATQALCTELSIECERLETFVKFECFEAKDTLSATDSKDKGDLECQTDYQSDMESEPGPRVTKSATTVSPRKWKSASQKRSDEARAKALERIRQRKLQEKLAEQKAAEKARAQSVSRTYLPQEGVARAVRRMREFRKTDPAASNEESKSKKVQTDKVSGSVDDGVTRAKKRLLAFRRKAVAEGRQGTANETKQDQPPEGTAASDPVSTVVLNRVSASTAPKQSRITPPRASLVGPSIRRQRKSTVRCHNQKPRSFPDITLANSVDHLQRTLREDSPLLDLRTSATFPPFVRKSTKPLPPRLATNDRLGAKVTPRIRPTGAGNEVTLAGSTQVLQRMLRSSEPCVMHTALWKWYARPLPPRRHSRRMEN